MHMPMLKNRVNGCYGNHEFFHSANKFIFMNKSISGVPMNDFAPIKNHPGTQARSNQLQENHGGFLVVFFSVIFYVFINIHEYAN